MTCGSDGQWIGEVPSCGVVMCPAVDNPQNGLVSGNHTYKSVVIFTCDEGMYSQELMFAFRPSGS